MQHKTIFFVFAGRKSYLEILKKYLLLILNNFEEAELHLWNFCRNSSDDKYLRELAVSIPRTKIFNQYYQGINNNTTCTKSPGSLCTCIKCRVGLWTEPYKFYASDSSYRNCNFIKIDDDILFLDINKISRFIKLLSHHQSDILTANVINNGICAMLDDNISKIVLDRKLLINVKDRNKNLAIAFSKLRFKLKGKAYRSREWWKLCTSTDFLMASHSYFLSNTETITNSPEFLIPVPRSRFSINFIGFSYSLMEQIALAIGKETSMNDEEIISSKFSIIMVSDFIACHLHFADQRACLSDQEEYKLLQSYNTLADEIIQQQIHKIG